MRDIFGGILMKEETVRLPGNLAFDVSKVQTKTGSKMKLSLKVGDHNTGFDLLYDELSEKGGIGYTLGILLNGHEVQHFCGCNEVTMECPEGKSPHCDCTKKPAQLKCA